MCSINVYTYTLKHMLQYKHDMAKRQQMSLLVSVFFNEYYCFLPVLLHTLDIFKFRAAHTCQCLAMILLHMRTIECVCVCVCRILCTELGIIHSRLYSIPLHFLFIRLIFPLDLLLLLFGYFLVHEHTLTHKCYTICVRRNVGIFSNIGSFSFTQTPKSRLSAEKNLCEV